MDTTTCQTQNRLALQAMETLHHLSCYGRAHHLFTVVKAQVVGRMHGHNDRGSSAVLCKQLVVAWFGHEGREGWRVVTHEKQAM